jgi:hypothetical protein
MRADGAAQKASKGSGRGGGKEGKELQLRKGEDGWNEPNKASLPLISHKEVQPHGQHPPP